MQEKHYILITVLSLLLVTAHSLSSVHAADNEDPELTSQSAGVSTSSSGVISGDFNNDGRDDLAIGVPNEDVGNTNIANAGAVNVIYGSAPANGLSATTTPDQIWTQDTASVEDFAEAGDRFGFAVA